MRKWATPPCSGPSLALSARRFTSGPALAPDVGGKNSGVSHCTLHEFSPGCNRGSPVLTFRGYYSPNSPQRTANAPTPQYNLPPPVCVARRGRDRIPFVRFQAVISSVNYGWML